MISSEEEARQAVCATINPILAFIEPRILDRAWTSSYERVPSEAHSLCYQLRNVFAPRRLEDMTHIFKRTQKSSAFQSILALFLEMAQFAGKLSPAELEAEWDNDKPPVWWSLVNAFSVMTLSMWMAEKSLPSLYGEAKAHYQNFGLELMQTLLKSKSLFERTDGRVAELLMDLRSQLLVFVPHRVYEDEIRHLPQPLERAYQEASFTFFWRMRFSSTIPSNPLLTPYKGIFGATSSFLSDIIHRMAMISPDEGPASLTGAIPRLTGHSYKELIEQCFKAIHYPLALGVDPNNEWRLVAMTVTFDDHNDLIEVLTSYHFITQSVEQALLNISKLRDAPLDTGKYSTATWFFYMAFGWVRYIAVVVERAQVSEAAQVLNEAVDSGLIFMLEAWQSTQMDSELRQDVSDAVFTLVGHISSLWMMTHKHTSDRPQLLKLSQQIHLIRERSTSKPYLSDDIKQRWVESDVYSGELEDGGLPRPLQAPERICGLPGCASMKSAKL
ncbi:hypothetical protein DL93DRAFT_2221325 [Clavulina sp. PMI_390]|nr:hypothetical protein DL93DRAFT_2221325 [Clavulina sp. PMI_390]